MKRHITIGIGVAVIVAMLAGCSANQTKGGLIGAGTGGLLGGIIGKQYGDTTKGAIVGAAVGGAAGAVIGDYMDRQAEEMKSDVDGAKVERVGEGIQVTFDSGILFATDSSELNSQARQNLDEFAEILQKYPDTEILIQGHTDATGSEEYNQQLSERRAASVSSYLMGHGVAAARIQTEGLGEMAPVATNDTPEGRAQNRRVEVGIVANEELKEAAKEGKTL